MPKLSLLLVPALLAACTPAPAPMAPAPVAPAAAADPATFPTVTYTMTLVPGDIPASAPPGTENGMAGPWEVTFTPDGRVRAIFNGQRVVEGTYQVNGNVLVLGQDSGGQACNATGRYNWHATATELHLQKLEDSCEGRAVVLTAHALVRK